MVEVDGKQYKEYYGSASEYQKVNTKTLKVRKFCYLLKVIWKIRYKMKEDLQSSISYAGGRDLHALTRVDYVIVKNSIWNGDSI